ncbi:MAG: alginate export family protein [Paracoccaceae bacterium]
MTHRLVTRISVTILAVSAQLMNATQAGADKLPPYETPRFEITMDDIDGTPNQLTDSLSVGAQIEIETTGEINFDLDREDAEDTLETAPSAKLKALYAPGPHLLAYGEAEVNRPLIHSDPDSSRPDPRLRINEAFLGYRSAEGFSATIGRREVSPDREWLFDTDFDGFDMVYRTDDFMITAAWWREEVIRKDLLGRHRDDRPDYLYLRGDVALSEDSQIGGWLVGQNGRRRDRDTDLLHLGVTSLGELNSDIDYWAEGAFVIGEEDGRPVRGFGFDIGGLWADRSITFRPHAAAGLAFGSGDDGDGTDTAFRQTGAQGNSQRFGGVSSAKIYGELVDPELSNLFVTTLSIGVRPTDRTSIGLIYHEYFQHRAEDELRDTNIDEDPSGDKGHLGREVDLVVGIKEFENIDLEFVGAVFLPGGAFDDDNDSAWMFESKIEFKF